METLKLGSAKSKENDGGTVTLREMADYGRREFGPDEQILAGFPRDPGEIFDPGE